VLSSSLLLDKYHHESSISTYREDRSVVDTPQHEAQIGPEAVVALTQELMRRMVALSGEIATSSGLNPSDLAALRALDAAAQSDGIAINRLGAALGLSSGAVSALVDRLERHGLAERQPDPRDRRRIFVVLTPGARALGAVHLRPYAERMQSAAAVLGPDERDTVARYLRAVIGPAADD
jgi:DNA-binding MarR family transcriptional regulator